MQHIAEATLSAVTVCKMARQAVHRCHLTTLRSMSFKSFAYMATLQLDNTCHSSPRTPETVTQLFGSDGVLDCSQFNLIPCCILDATPVSQLLFHPRSQVLNV